MVSPCEKHGQGLVRDWSNNIQKPGLTVQQFNSSNARQVKLILPNLCNLWQACSGTAPHLTIVIFIRPQPVYIFRAFETLNSIKMSKIIEHLEDVTIRFAGDSGDGMQLVGTQFSETSGFAGSPTGAAT